MRFGIIGAGPIGSNIAKKLVESGYDVKIADARGIKHLEGKKLTGTPVIAEEVIKNIDVLITSIPFHALPSIRNIIDKVGEEVVVVDTSNYYPQISNEIEEIENGMVESIWVSNHLGRPLIKAFNNVLAYTLEHHGAPEGTHGRIAIAIAGDNQSHKQIIMSVANDLGFDAVDGGSLSDSWRQQPGTPAYCTELTKEELVIALNKANQERAPFLRDKVMEKLSASQGAVSIQDVIRANREIFNP